MLTFRHVGKDICSGAKVDMCEDDVHVWGVSLEAEADAVEQCRQCLSSEELARMDRRVSETSRRHFVVAHGMLRMVLSRYSNRRPQELSFQNMPSGKPVLQGTDLIAKTIRFNLSHSHGRALIAVSKDREVGVDLEKIRADRDVVALAKRFFAPQEQELLMNVGLEEQHRTFARIWVAKEAVLKAQGSGLTFPLARHRIELSRDGKTCRLVNESDLQDIVPPAIRFLPLEEGWVGAIAAEGSTWRVTLCV